MVKCWPTEPGCSKCRHAKRGCRRCVENFVPASAVRAAKAAEKAVEKDVKRKPTTLSSPLADRDPNVADKRPRGRPPKSAQKPASGVTPKTPKTVQKTAEVKAAIASPPSPASAMQVQPTAQKTVSAHKRKATGPSEPATATKRAAIDVGVRWADRLEMYEGDTTTTTTTTRDDKENTGAKGPMAAMGPMVDGLDDEITRAALGGVGRYGDRSDEDLCDFPPELREALKKVSKGLVLGLHPVAHDVNAEEDEDEDDDEGVETGLSAEEERRRTQVAQLQAGTLTLANRLRTLQQGPALVH